MSSLVCHSQQVLVQAVQQQVLVQGLALQ